MVVEKTHLKGVLVVRPVVRGDSRGRFLETYHKERYEAAGITTRFVQDNLSVSQKGVLRGLHYQDPYPQAKLVSVAQGSVFDVAVDIDPNSETYKQWFGIHLVAAEGTQLFIPEGYAHGFLCLEDNTVFSYKCSEIYHPETEKGVRWNDPAIGINWPMAPQVISEKDLNLPLLTG